MKTIQISSSEANYLDEEGHVPTIQTTKLAPGTEVQVHVVDWGEGPVSEVIRATPYNRWWILHLRKK